MMPLNYAILLHFTKVERASADDVIAALAPQYGRFRGLRRPAVVEALMTAEKNGLLEEAGYDLDADGALRVYYRVSAESCAAIKRYIGPER